MNRRGFLTALIGGAVASAAVAEIANAQFIAPFEAPPEWEHRRDRYERYRRYRYEREREAERRRRYYRRRWRNDDEDDDD